MRLQNLTIIFVVIMLPIILLISLYISNGLKTIQYQAIYDNGLVSATSDAIYAFETNSAENIYSDNAETKRSIIKSSIKMFEKSLCNTCNISSYNTSEIEEYIPAIVFGMYDGFYMYAPSYNSNTGKYEHSLKSYVYYSETLDDGTIIRYSLDNYVSVSVKIRNEYIIKEGYLIDIGNTSSEGTQYKRIAINAEDTDAVNYYKYAYEFTNWFLNETEIHNKSKNGNKADYLNINANNDPEDPNSAFNQHKRQIIKNKIEGVLNSTITAYSNKTWGQNYKMPKLSEYDWEKIYNNISVISFFQGKKIGLTKYNGYCVLNSTNSSEYVNPSLMYFIDNDDEYHDIRCSEIKDITDYIKGYRIGSFEKKTIENESGEQVYKYEHNELACYNCINGTLSTSTSVYDYIKPDGGTATLAIKISYWTSLARERYKKTSQTSTNIETSGEENNSYTVKFDANANGDKSVTGMPTSNPMIIGKNEELTLPNGLTRTGYDFKGWSTNPDDINGTYPIEIIGNTTLYAIWNKQPEKIKISYIAYEKKDNSYNEKTLLTEDITGTSYKIKEISNSVEYDGYVFIGWEYENEIKQENTTIDITGKKDIKLYAIFVEDFNITFNAYNYVTNSKLEKYTGEETIYTNINKVRLKYIVKPENVKIYGRNDTKQITVSLNKKVDNNYQKTTEYEIENGDYIIKNENAYRISAQIDGTNIVKNTSTIVIDRTKPKITEKYRKFRTVRVYVDESYIASVQLIYNSTTINMDYDTCDLNAIGGYREFNYSCTVSYGIKLDRKVVVCDKARQ